MDEQHSRRDRLMGKLFGGNKEKAAEKEREKRYMVEQTANDISAFLGRGDKLAISHPPPPPPSQGHREYDKQQPMLALDTTQASRFPASSDLGNSSKSSLPTRTRSHSLPRKKGKGLIVRFSDNTPEIIGEGGDECETFTIEIGKRKRSQPTQASSWVPSGKENSEYVRSVGGSQETRPQDDDDDDYDFIPGRLRRTQTGFSSIEAPEPEAKNAPPPAPARALPAADTSRSRTLDNTAQNTDNRRSFLEVQQLEQREAEGMAFAEAMKAAMDGIGEETGEASSPEPVRPTAQRFLRKEPAPVMAKPPIPAKPPTLVSGAGPPLAPVGDSVRSAIPPNLRDRSDRDSRPSSSRSVASQQSQDHTAPPTPVRNSARRSPLPPIPITESEVATQAYVPPRRSPLPPLPTQADESYKPGLDNSRDRLHKNDGEMDDSASSTYSDIIPSPELLDHYVPGSQVPADRKSAPNSPDKPGRQQRPAPAVSTMLAPSLAPSLPVSPMDASPQDEAYQDFLNRTKHLYELFRLHAEQFTSLGSSKPTNLARAALWWLLKGRTALEMAIRNRSPDLDDQKAFMASCQAYTDLTKAHWLAELALPEIAEGKFSPIDGEFGEVRQAVRSTLIKLAGSMKRNGFLPPEESFMPQMMDKSIWVEYPSLSQDMIALLNGNWGSLLAAASQPTQPISALEALPIGDTPTLFSYGRVNADVYLTEQGLESTQTYFPCILSINRPTQQPELLFTLASQTSTLTLRIGGEKDAGPTWDHLKWRPDSNSLELKMPRGFQLAIQCSVADFRTLWNVFDFGARVQSYLFPRKEEVIAYRAQLVGFHYFDSDPKARSFPKEPVGQCEVGLFERVLKESSPTGPRSFHGGFRIAVVTGPKTRTLSGVTHSYTPQMPIQYAYLRGEKREPMIQLSYSDSKIRCRMVLAFSSSQEREKFLALLKGSYLHHDEEMVAEVALQGFSMSEGLADAQGGFQALQRLPWQLGRVMNEKYHAGDNPPTVLSEKLRLEINSMDNKGICVSSVIDRINMAPGEFKLRLGTKDILMMQVLRNPQVDMSISILDRPGLVDAPREFTSLQNRIGQSQSVRTYRFNSFKDLHSFQSAVTGVEVLFDGVASSLNISRRRMVVPVYKKWESGAARVQVVQQDSTIQLLAFFEDWHHGQCMSFVLRASDSYESFGRGGKAGLKLVDAKFPLPKVPEEDQPPTDDMAFICLDMPDYAGEHDDISVVFDDEGERDKLCQVLPAPVKGSRLSKLVR